MKNIFKSLYISTLFYQLLGAVILLFVLSFGFPFLFVPAQTALALLLVVTVADGALLFRKSVAFSGERHTPKMLSLGNLQHIKLTIENRSPFTFALKVIDELPFQLQIRHQEFSFALQGQSVKEITYPIRPVKRGSYLFGNARLFLATSLGLLQRRYTLPLQKAVPVFPSIMDMKQFELMTVAKISFQEGIKKIRRIGQSHEFEQIKNYTAGDDFQRINWKASSRGLGLMVNHYEDEKSQQVFAIIDKSRTMKMPFDGMTLLDYAINSALVIANTSLRKKDKAGLITFAEQVNTIIKPSRLSGQLRAILQALYSEQEGQADANFERMYQVVRKTINGRSLLFLYTNFESLYAMQRVLPIIRQLNKQHLLVVIIFENTELLQYASSPAENLEEIYFKTIAQKLNYDKKEIAKELTQYGIQTIFTKPQHLSLNVINKYLELKSRGLI